MVRLAHRWRHVRLTICRVQKRVIPERRVGGIRNAAGQDAYDPQSPWVRIPSPEDLVFT